MKAKRAIWIGAAMYAESIRMQLKPDVEAKAFDVARYISRILRPGEFTVIERLRIAQDLCQGSVWEPVPSSLQIDPRDTDESAMFDIHVTMPRNEWQERCDKQAEQRALLERAVSGDAEAALEYCRLEFDGHINHGAMG